MYRRRIAGLPGLEMVVIRRSIHKQRIDTDKIVIRGSGDSQVGVTRYNTKVGYIVPYYGAGTCPADLDIVERAMAWIYFVVVIYSVIVNTGLGSTVIYQIPPQLFQMRLL